MMLIYIIALAYAATSPIILPFALIYFIFSWIMWRYNILYVSERCFESGGQIWDTVFKQVCCCMFIFEFFTGLPLLLCLSMSAHVCPEVCGLLITCRLAAVFAALTVETGKSDVSHVLMRLCEWSSTSVVSCD